MDSFARIVQTILTGPGIAAPTAEFCELSRDELSDAEAHQVDQMIAACRFFEIGDLTPAIKIIDGPHPSQLSVETTDGRSHRVSFIGVPAQLRELIHYVQTRGKTISP